MEFIRKVRISFLISLGILVLQCSGSSQVQVGDSLKSRLLALSRTNSIDSTYIKILNDYTYNLQYLNPDSALYLGQWSSSISQKINFPKGYAEANRNIGIVHYLRGNFIQALEFFYEALKVAEEIKDKKGIARIYNNVGLIYNGQGKYQEALDAQMKSLELKREINDRQGLGTSLNNVANIYKNLDNFTESLRYHKMALEVREEFGDERAIAASQNNIGWLYLKQHNFNDAGEYFRRTLPIAIHSQDKILISDVYQGLAECMLEKKQYGISIDFAKQALQVATSINLKDQLRDCNETLSRIYKAQKKFDKALFHFELFKLYADSINNMEIVQRTAFLETQYGFEKKESMLKAQQAIINANHDRSTLQLRWIIFSILGGLLFVSIAASLIYRSKHKLKMAYKKLELATEEINSKSEALRDINIALIKQKAEVTEQRDLVTLQNQKLQEISDNLEVHRKNLEMEVEKRTQEIKDYAKRMEQFAFFTAHDLRAPVATILGLANLLSHHTNNPEDKHLIFEKLVITTRQLDRVVKQLNQTIEERNLNSFSQA